MTGNQASGCVLDPKQNSNWITPFAAVKTKLDHTHMHYNPIIPHLEGSSLKGTQVTNTHGVRGPPSCALQAEPRQFAQSSPPERSLPGLSKFGTMGPSMV